MNKEVLCHLCSGDGMVSEERIEEFKLAMALSFKKSMSDLFNKWYKDDNPLKGAFFKLWYFEDAADIFINSLKK